MAFLRSGGSVRGANVGSTIRRFGLIWVAAGIALAVFGVALVTSPAVAPLFPLVVPLAIASVYGWRASVTFAVFISVLAVTWWAMKGMPGGIAWCVSRCVTCLTAGFVFGWLVESRQRVVRQLANQRDLSLDLIATVNFQGFFTDVNPAFTRTLGFDRSELLAQPCLTFVHPDDQEATARAVAEQIEAGRELVDFQNRYLCEDGTYRWLEWSSRGDPRAQELVAIGRDVTDRKCLEEQEHQYQERLRTEVAQRTRELDDARLETVERLALVAEFRDDQTFEHTQRVGLASALLAQELGLDPAFVTLIRHAAPLHDVGKVGTPDSILLKPLHLTRGELDIVRGHAQAGARILGASSSRLLRLAEEIAANHHEWWDGTGYPSGLAGEAIPLSGRIVALVDVFDALTHDRPYKIAWSIADSVDEINRLAGLQFDPTVVKAFNRLDPAVLAGPITTRHRLPDAS